MLMRRSKAPVGSLQIFAGTTAPWGYLVCGQAVSRVTHARLFAVIGTTWGAGDGETTFDLPPLNKYLLPSATGVGASIGNAEHSHTIEGHALSVDEIPTHSHPLDGLNLLTAPGGDTNGLIGGTGNGPVTPTVGNAGSGQAHTHGINNGSNIPPSIKTLLCIKY